MYQNSVRSHPIHVSSVNNSLGLTHTHSSRANRLFEHGSYEFWVNFNHGTDFRTSQKKNVIWFCPKESEKYWCHVTFTYEYVGPSQSTHNSDIISYHNITAHTQIFVISEKKITIIVSLPLYSPSPIPKL